MTLLTMEEVLDCFKAGQKAYEHGVPITDTPTEYEYLDEASLAIRTWIEGWSDAAIARDRG